MYKNQSGNVLFIILIAVALFAALSYTIAQSGRGGTSALSREQAALQATEIIQYGNTIAQAVSQIRLRGYLDTEISFENSDESGYVNANCMDDACEVFNVAGGGMTYIEPNENWLVDISSLSKTGAYGEVYFMANADIDTVGTDCDDAAERGCKDLLLLIPYIRKEICDQINAKLSIDDYASKNINNFDYADSDKFTGSYGATNNASIGNGTSFLDNKLSGCISEWDHPSYTFFQVLIAR